MAALTLHRPQRRALGQRRDEGIGGGRDCDADHVISRTDDVAVRRLLLRSLIGVVLGGRRRRRGAMKVIATGCAA